MLVRLAEKNSEIVKILKVDVSTEEQWADRENIRSIPTFQIYRAGKKLKQFSGAPPEEHIQQMIDQYASKDNVAVNTSGQKPTEQEVEPAIRPMPKDWLPPGITKKNQH